MARKLRILGVPLLVGLIAACGTSGSPAATRHDHLPGFFPWSAVRSSGSTLVIGGSADYCAGRKKPTLSSPIIRYEGSKVFIKVQLEVPAAPRVASTHGGSIPVKEVCAGVDLFVRRTVRLAVPLEGRQIFDSGFSPPKLRWPGK